MSVLNCSVFIVRANFFYFFIALLFHIYNRFTESLCVLFSFDVLLILLLLGVEKLKPNAFSSVRPKARNSALKPKNCTILMYICIANSITLSLKKPISEANSSALKLFDCALLNSKSLNSKELCWCIYTGVIEFVSKLKKSLLICSYFNDNVN